MKRMMLLKFLLILLYPVYGNPEHVSGDFSSKVFPEAMELLQNRIEEVQQAADPVFRKISGKVVDETGAALPGVTITVKGTRTGVVSDVQGNFTIAVTGDKPAVLVFSFIGMETVEVACPDDKPVTVTMHESSTLLEEAVVDGGYQKLPRKDMVGAFTVLQGDDLKLDAYTSIDQMLQGRVAGLVAVNTSSRVGRSPQLTIRGVSTVLGSTAPLWVVDGIIQPDPMPFDLGNTVSSDLAEMVTSQISWLNPSDIETVTVLKDASATAVYGSRASNGVIVVTTKRGKAERMSVRYSVSMGIRFRPVYDQFDLMNSQERILFSKEAYDAGARYQAEPFPQTCTYEGLMHLLNSHKIDETVYNDHVKWLETVNTDWLKLLTRNSFNHNHNLSISGGSKKTTYNASFSYYNNKGVEIGNDVDRLSMRLNLNTQLMEKLRLDVSLNGSFGNTYGYAAGVNPLSYATSTSRALPAYDRNGDRLYFKSLNRYAYNSSLIPLGYNILNEMEHSHSRNKSHTFSTTINLNYKVLPWLDYEMVNGVSYNTSGSESYAGAQTNYVARMYRGYDYESAEINSPEFKAAMLPFGGVFYTNNSNSVSYTMQHKVMFSKTFHSHHRINAMVAAELRSIKSTSGSNTVWGYVPERGEKIMKPTPIDQLTPIGVSKPTNSWAILESLYDGDWRNNERTDNYFSVFATLAYSLKDRYVLNANVRNDVSNRFGQDVNKRIDPTYSFGLQWRMSEEPFIKDNISWLNQLNFRGTFGIQGNVVNSISPDLIVRQEGILKDYNEYYVTIASLPNPLLKWERTKTWNLGLDWQLLNGISMSLEYYGRRSNAIVSQDVAQEYGVAQLRLNGGRIKNNGVEYTLNLTPFKRDNFAWTVNVNLSKNWNKSESDNARTGAQATTKANYLNGSTDRLLKKGYPLGGFWSYSFAGLDPETGYPTFNKLEYETPDANVDPTTFLVYSGQKNPYFTGGFNTRIKYRSFSLGANFSALVGGKKRLPNPYSQFTQGKLPNPEVNLSRLLNRRWKKPGDEQHTHIPALWTALTGYTQTLPDGLPGDIYQMWAQSDAQVVNSSMLRCTQISLSWYMNQKLCRKARLSSLSVSASVSNVFVIADKRFDGFDPELGNSVMPRMFSFGFNVGF